MQARLLETRRVIFTVRSLRLPRGGVDTRPVSTPLEKIATTPDAEELVADEIARLELLRQLALGAAHTLNNAFTAILGETLCLADERKSDPLVAEACALIQSEVERCARLTRQVAVRVQRRESVLDETNIAALVRSLEPLLRETVSRSVSIDVEIPDRSILVRGPGEDLELLVLLVAHRLARIPGRGAALRIALGAHDARTVELLLEVRGSDATPLEPRAAGSWSRLVAEAELALGDRHGVRVEGARDGCVRLLFTPA